MRTHFCDAPHRFPSLPVRSPAPCSGCHIGFSAFPERLGRVRCSRRRDGARLKFIATLRSLPSFGLWHLPARKHCIGTQAERMSREAGERCWVGGEMHLNERAFTSRGGHCLREIRLSRKRRLNLHLAHLDRLGQAFDSAKATVQREVVTTGPAVL